MGENTGKSAFWQWMGPVSAKFHSIPCSAVKTSRCPSFGTPSLRILVGVCHTNMPATALCIFSHATTCEITATLLRNIISK